MKRIRLIRRIIFRDFRAEIVKQYEAGTILEYTAKTKWYYVCSMGGIYFDEAEEIAA